MAVRIVTDSTCDLPPALIEAYGIHVVPLTVSFGDETFLDGIEITAKGFYERLQASALLPKTSQPPVERFANVYRELAQETDEILSIHISSRLSGTLNSASVAREEVADGVRIDLIDSYNVSAGMGLIVLEAAEAAKQGATLEEAAAVTRRAMDRVTVTVVVDTLEYLQRGGRIGRARSFLGSVLSIKPIIQVADGEVAPVERVRTRAKAIERIYQLASEQHRSKRMFIASSGNLPEAEQMAARLRPVLPHTDIGITQLGPIVGVYTGPNALGFTSLERE